MSGRESELQPIQRFRMEVAAEDSVIAAAVRWVEESGIVFEAPDHCARCALAAAVAELQEVRRAAI